MFSRTLYSKRAGDTKSKAKSSMTHSVKTLMALARRNPSGFTVLTSNLEKVTKGWVVALKDTQNCFGEEGCKKAFMLAESQTGYFGGWKYNKLYYFDAVFITYDESEAIRLGIENEQIGVYNIETGTYKELS
jgi:hypothetical protein